MKNKKFVGTVMVPAMLHMFVFIVIPIVIGLVISFFNYNPLSSDNKFIGLENFVRLVQDADFRKALLNTLLFVLITVTLNIGIALVVAQMISWFKSNKVRSFFRMVFFLPIILAACHLAAAFPLLRRLLVMFNLTDVKLIVICMVATLFVFMVIYYIVFKITSRAYYRIVGNQI